MKRVRILAAVFLVSLLCQSFALGAAPAADERWTRTEDGGGYVTIRVPAASDSQTADVFQLAVRYADTQEPVALSSTYLDGYLFATVPASEAGRPPGGVPGHAARLDGPGAAVSGGTGRQ